MCAGRRAGREPAFAEGDAADCSPEQPRLDLLPYYIWEHFRRFCLPAVEKYFRPYYIRGTFFRKSEPCAKKYFSVPTIYRTYLFAFAQMLSKKIFLANHSGLIRLGWRFIPYGLTPV